MGLPRGRLPRTWGYSPPLSLPAPPKAPTPTPHLPQGGGGLLDTLGRSGPGSGGCESPLPWGFGVSPKSGVPPLPAPGWHSLVGLAQEGGSHWGGVTPHRTGGHPLPPQNLFSRACTQLLGGLGAWQCPHRGVTGGCMLHPSCLGLFGGGSGGGGSCCDHPCAKLLGEGGPQTCQGAGNGAELGRGGSTARLQRRAPRSSCPQHSSTSPPRMPGALLLHSGGHWGPPPALLGVCTPTGSAFEWGGPRCAGWGGTGPSGWIQATPARDPLPSPRLQGLSLGQGWLQPLRCPLPWLADPPIWPYVPGGGCVCPPSPVPWLVLSLGLTNYGALDSGFTIDFKLLLQAGLGGSCRALGTSERCSPPPLHGDPPVLPPGGAGGLWPPGHAELAFVCPGACRRGWGHPKTRGPPPKNCLGGAQRAGEG